MCVGGRGGDSRTTAALCRPHTPVPRAEALGGNTHTGTGLLRGPAGGWGRGGKSSTEDEANKNMKTITDSRGKNDLS